nr:A/G-specific adenine glycosylase [uncultured Blautia sp.]
MKMEKMAGNLNNIVQPLLEWYRDNRRQLPWRDQNNAYYTWVSEIMLQQTRVEAVKPYFKRFIGELPDIQALAACPEEKLMKLWEGLGYYNRVRNMQLAAQTVVSTYGGKLPASYKQLLELKGIGNYTAGAIASIAYQIPVPAVDGNVLRVLSRITEDRQDIMKQSVRRQAEEKLQEVIPQECPGDFNQAMMELGAVVCVPNGPARCEDCPIAKFCLAYQHGIVEELPVKAPKKQRSLENRTVLVIQDGEKTVIQKRPKKGLLAGLYELPNLEGHLSRDEVLAEVERMQLEPLYIEKLPDAKHVFSHIEWRMTGYLIRVASLDTDREMPFIFAEKKQSERQYAIPSAFRAYVKYMKEETEK